MEKGLINMTLIELINNHPIITFLILLLVGIPAIAIILSPIIILVEQLTKNRKKNK